VSNFGPKTISFDWRASWCYSVLPGTMLYVKSWPSPSACSIILITQQPVIVILLHCVVWATERSIQWTVFLCIQCLKMLTLVCLFLPEFSVNCAAFTWQIVYLWRDEGILLPLRIPSRLQLSLVAPNSAC